MKDSALYEAIPSETGPRPTSLDTRKTAIEAAAFRRLLQHLDQHKEVQNIELMNLAGFCRNCLAKWYVTAAAEQGETLTYDAAREIVYGMPYAEWKSRYQREATAAQQQQFAATDGGGEPGAPSPVENK